MNRAPWTEHQVQMLTRMRANGSTNAEIASALGKTETAVKAKIKALGLPKPDPCVRPKRGPDHRKWQWQRRSGGPANPRGRNASRTAMRTSADPDTTRKAVDALTPRCCRWPMGDPGTPGFSFCGARKAPGTPYCAEHTARAWRPLRRARRNGAR